jgi:hypothetical protein
MNYEYIIYYLVVLFILIGAGYVIKVKIFSRSNKKSDDTLSVQIGNKVSGDQAGRDIKK